jgi:BlaI family transcriptional regulator, penicillinase repressor
MTSGVERRFEGSDRSPGGNRAFWGGPLSESTISNQRPFIGNPEEFAMARAASTQPTEGELEILKVLWEKGPSELKQVCEGLRQARPVATTTVATMLKLMQEKGLVQRNEGEGARGSVYSAGVSRKAASTGLVRRLVDMVFDGSARRLVAHMLENEKLSERDRAEIRRLLDEDDARRERTPRSRKTRGRS